MADWYGKSLMEDQDFQEEDVWGVVQEREVDSNTKVNKFHKVKKRASSSSSTLWTSNDGARMIPRSCNEGRMPQQSSAPMGIPDWSKIYLEKSKGPSDACYGHNTNGHHDVNDDEDDDGKMVPPHEYIARRLARTHITPSSMCEGVGRTLKGRDLSKLRNAILTKTGFLE
ncbi:senescence regulator S40 [Artemisia annua]|uniref:Senescence regulator S40 n=1 Tax=Artemisia annua TaxID=35608 RepID=A0A2U1Q9G4_ARTAN|nr:senescence regulator S40 [Artemisia annua]